MSLQALHKNHGVGAVIALIGMAFYAMLFPWHTVSQTSLLLAHAGVGTTTIPSCHREATGELAKPAQPVKQTNSPICSGLAALQLALTNPPGLSSFAASIRWQVFARHGDQSRRSLGAPTAQPRSAFTLSDLSSALNCLA